MRLATGDCGRSLRVTEIRFGGSERNVPHKIGG